MLSGGNPTGGANPAGIGTSLNYIGKHVYATSGSFPDTQSQATMLKFDTGNAYIVGQFSFFGSTHTDQTAGSIGAGNTNNFQVLMDGQTVAVVKTDTNQEDMPAEIVIPMLLPPNTKFEIKVVSAGAAADYSTQVSFLGEVY